MFSPHNTVPIPYDFHFFHFTGNNVLYVISNPPTHNRLTINHFTAPLLSCLVCPLADTAGAGVGSRKVFNSWVTVVQLTMQMTSGRNLEGSNEPCVANLPFFSDCPPQSPEQLLTIYLLLGNVSESVHFPLCFPNSSWIVRLTIPCYPFLGERIM